MKTWLAANGPIVAIALVAGVLGAVAAQFWLRPSTPTIEVRGLDPQPTPVTPIWVHVEGAVAAPGVYALNGDARVFEAIGQAGGATDEADVSVLNLAARVTDGQKLVVPSQGQAFSGSVAASAPSTAASSAPGPRININTATDRVLESLPGVGPVTAQRIVQYRQINGPFARIEDLRDTRIVTTAAFERIKGLITVA